MHRSLPKDFEARQAALDPTRSFAVSAPAGSGKTGLLTQRLLKLLSLCESPEEVLAITFTRKAAGEMQDRVLQALWKTKEQPKPTNPHDLLTWQLAINLLKHDEIKGWNLLQCPQRLRIQTIDSLCNSIARQLPIASGFGSQPKPNDDADSAYRQAIHQLFSELETDSPIRDDLTRLLEHLDNNIQSLENLLVQLLAKRDQWLGVIFQAQHQNARHYLESVLNEIIEDALADAQKILQLHGSELASISDWAATNLLQSSPDSPIAQLHGATGLPEPRVENINQWLAIAHFLLITKAQFRKSLTYKEGFPAAKENKDSAAYKKRFAEMVGAITESHPDAEIIIDELRNLPPCHYADDQWALLDCLTRLLPRLAARLDLIFAEIGETDFTAVNQAALTALGYEDSPTDIALQLDYRIRHILIDEFQDTSSTQLELLQKLTTGWQKDDGRSLFIVGDGMQSCYSFRNANVGIFLEARAQGIGNLPLNKLDLSVNFRSQAGVVNWINQQFSTAFPAKDDISRGAVKYSHSHAFKEQLEDTAVDIFISPFTKTADEQYSSSDEDDEPTHENIADSGNRYIAELQEADAIAQLIKRLRTQQPNDSIALLARSRNHLQHIFPAMSRIGLSWQATEIDSLAQRMAIIDLTSLTQALLNPADRIAWLSILRAPWCGLNLIDLHAIANTSLTHENPTVKENDFPIIWQQVLHHEKIILSEIGRAALIRFINVIQPALATRQRKLLRAWIEGIWLALGGPATLLDQQDIHDIPRFFSLLEKHQKSGYIYDWHSFKRAIEKLYAAPHQNADPKLQVMTMHKSKGLEFDHVIIPRLHKLPPNDGQQLLLWRERLNTHGERQLLLGPLAPAGGEKDSLYKYIQKEASMQLHYEATRLFYVGCTRAIKKLYLFASLAKNEENEWKNPPKKSLLNSIWNNIQADIQTITAIKNTYNEPPKPVFERAGLQQLLRLASEWAAPPLMDNEILKAYRGKEVDDDINTVEIEALSAKLSRHTGILIHQALQNLASIFTHTNMEMWISKENKIEKQRWIDKQSLFWNIYLKQQGFTEIERHQSLAKIQHAINNTLNDQHGQWLLDGRHEQSACELAIIHKQGNKIDLKLRESIIDRTFIDNGIRWIIDYKSSEPTHEQNLNDFFTQEIISYKKQLLRYKQCFEALGESHIKTALYFPLIDGNEKLVIVDI